MVDAPLVSAVMVTGKSPERRLLAKSAIRSFLAQTHPNKELLILNSSLDSLIRDFPHETELHEWTVPGDISLGHIRNIGLEEAQGDWIMQWDDDDWSHPERMAYQLDAARGDCAVLLRWQIRYSFNTNYAFPFRWRFPSVPAIPGTILHSRTDGRYRDLSRAEDDKFVQDNFPNCIVLENGPETAKTHYYLRFFHGANTWNEKHVMQGHVGPQHKDNWSRLNGIQAAYLRTVLNSNYAEVQ